MVGQHFSLTVGKALQSTQQQHSTAQHPSSTCAQLTFIKCILPRPFQIVVALPTLVIPLRSMLERGQVSLPGVGHRAVTTFESNVLFALRFMIDRDVVGCNWVELPRGKYTLR